MKSAIGSRLVWDGGKKAAFLGKIEGEETFLLAFYSGDVETTIRLSTDAILNLDKMTAEAAKQIEQYPITSLALDKESHWHEAEPEQEEETPA